MERRRFVAAGSGSVYKALVAVAVFACGKTSGHDEEFARIAKHGPWTAVTPSSIVHEYENNSVAADERYKGKGLRVTATVDHVSEGPNGVPVVHLLDFEQHEDQPQLECRWGGSPESAARLRRGPKVIVLGVGGGVVETRPMLLECYIEPAEQTNAIEGRQGR